MSEILDKAREELDELFKNKHQYVSMANAFYISCSLDKLKQMEQRFEVGVKPYKYEYENGEQFWLFCCHAEPHVLEEDDINNTLFCKYCGTKIDWSDEE